MESLAYIEIALAHYQSEVTPLNSVKGLEKQTFFNLSRGLQWSVLLLLVLFSGFGTAKVALAQRLGESGFEVRQVQNRLRELGYFNQEPTGVYGSITEDAVIRFQRSRGLMADGIVGPATRAALFNNQTTFNTQTTSLPPPPLFQSTSSPQRELVILAPTDPPRLATESRILRQGSRGEAVQRLQQELQEREFYFGQIDGIYGESTENSVERFQRTIGLIADGVAGSETLRALGLTSQSGIRREDESYVVVIPDSNGLLLTQVRQVFPSAFRADSRRGAYIQVGSFLDYETAASRSYNARARGFDARVVYF